MGVDLDDLDDSVLNYAIDSTPHNIRTRANMLFLLYDSRQVSYQRVNTAI